MRLSPSENILWSSIINIFIFAPRKSDPKSIAFEPAPKKVSAHITAQTITIIKAKATGL